MRIAIIGSRNYKNLANVRNYVRKLKDKGHIIISGGARGVDLTAESEARANGIELRVFNPDLRLGSPQAFFERNVLILQNCDKLVAFWDCKSSGTRWMVWKAIACRIPIQVFPDIPNLNMD